MAGINGIIQGWVERQGKALTTSQKAKEQELRPQLVKAYEKSRAARYEMGRLLVEYRKHFRGIYLSLYAAIGVDERTARNYVADYQRASRVTAPLRDAAAVRGYDLAEKRHQALGDALALKSETKPADVDAVVEAAIKADRDRKKATRMQAAKNLPPVEEPSYDDDEEVPITGKNRPVESAEEEDGRDVCPTAIPIKQTKDWGKRREELFTEVKAAMVEVFRDETKAQEEINKSLVRWAEMMLGELRRKAA